MLSAYSSGQLWTNALALWKLFFEKHLILDVKTTLRLQKPHCENIWTLKIKVISAHLGNKEHKAMFLVVSRSDVQFGFEHPFLWVLDRAPKQKFVHPWISKTIYRLYFLFAVNYTNEKKFHFQKLEMFSS